MRKAGFDIEWIELATATNAEVEAWIDAYDGIDETDYVEGSTSYISDAEVATWATGTAPDDRVAFLETLRAAEAKGATVEFNKMEGINVNFDGLKSGAVPFMYVAMAEVRGAMAPSTASASMPTTMPTAWIRWSSGAPTMAPARRTNAMSKALRSPTTSSSWMTDGC